MVVQGLGNVGSHFARLIQDDGVVIVGIGERDGTLSAPDGLDIHAVLAHRQATGSIRDCPGATTLERPADCWNSTAIFSSRPPWKTRLPTTMPAGIGAALIVEAANGPTTSAADAILRSPARRLFPISSPMRAGVTVSYFEWVKNLSHMRFGRMAKRVGIQTQQRMISGIEDLTGRGFPQALRDDRARYR